MLSRFESGTISLSNERSAISGPERGNMTIENNAASPAPSASRCYQDDEWESEQFDDEYDPANDCPRCHGEGEIPTADYESYFGAQMKPCPQCHGKLDGLGHGRLSC